MRSNDVLAAGTTQNRCFGSSRDRTMDRRWQQLKPCMGVVPKMNKNRAYTAVSKWTWFVAIRAFFGGLNTSARTSCFYYLEIQKMQYFKKFKRKFAWLGVVSGVLSGMWWIGVYVHQGWELVHRYV